MCISESVSVYVCVSESCDLLSLGVALVERPLGWLSLWLRWL
jgi:hypothetical protein